MTPWEVKPGDCARDCGRGVLVGLHPVSYIRTVTLASMSSTAIRISRHSDPRVYARRIIQALAKGETASCTAYVGDHRRLGGGVDHILHAIDALVLAEIPAAQSSGSMHFPGGETVWVWSLGEPTPVAFWPRQQPETLDVEIELQGAMPTPAERFPDREFG
jgi:hypothetical protein